MRFRILRAVTLFGVAVVAGTELLSSFEGLARIPLACFWVSIAAATAILAARRSHPIRRQFKLDAVALVCLIAIGAILALTGATAWFSAPNSADAMAYHLPRVIYWAEQGSVRFFPTPYFNQIMLQPFAEYCMLHLYLLSGTDHFTNLVQWFASLISIMGVSAIAGHWGASAAGQALATLFCATLPGGILASSGAKNDYVMAMWLIAAAYFALRFAAAYGLGDGLLAGAALGLALLTKATAYLFAPWVLLAILAYPLRRSKSVPAASLAALIALALNAPHYVRNLRLSGSPLGFDSAQGDGLFRWRNESFGWRQTASNILRNASEQLGARSQRWNNGIYQAVEAIHDQLGIDPNDPATTWRWATFQPPKNANHEADAPNLWHLALLAITVAVLTWRAIRGRDRQRALYALALICGFATFCVYLKWQPYQARLFLPLFVLAAPLMSIWTETRIAPAAIPILLTLFLVNNARHPLLENWVRPLQGPRSVLHTPRDSQYFSDMSQWGNSQTYRDTVEFLAGSGCTIVGLDITRLQLEYPLQALLRERQPRAMFLHTGVENASAQYRQPIGAPACAVVCLDCDGDSGRLQLYPELGTRTRVGRFVILQK